MKVLSILALVLFVSANSFAQEGAAQPATGGAQTAQPANNGGEAPKMEKKEHGKKKKKHAHKKEAANG